MHAHHDLHQRKEDELKYLTCEFSDQTTEVKIQL